MEFSTGFTKNIFKSKYLLPGEETPDEAVNRIIKVIHRYYPEYSKKIEEYIHNKWLLPAGGLWRAAMNPDKNVSCVNCTTLPQPEDNLESIFDSYYWWAKYAAFGQGEGIDLSKLRPRGSMVHNSSHSSTGAVSFMQIYNSILEVIAQEGRRGASLISLHISHPDILEFIFIKDKDGILENSNISIQVSDEFMKLAGDPEALWYFKFKNKYETIEKKIGAAELFEIICNHAWKSGDPGLQFIDTARKESNSDVLGHNIISTNACCLVSGTLIETDKGKIPIKEIYNRFHKSEQFKVKSFNIETNKEEWEDVSNAILSGINENIVSVEMEDENGAIISIDCTIDHQFYITNRGYIKAKDLYINDKVITDKCKKLLEYKIKRVLYKNIKSDVYDLTVKNNHNFFANDVLLHNSEQYLDPDNVCLLSSINIGVLENPYYHSSYDYKIFENIIEHGIVMLDAFRKYEYEEGRSPNKIQRQKLIEMPRVGLGITGLADHLIGKNIIYGSPESITSVGDIFKTLAQVSYKTSYQIAKSLGNSFQSYDKKKYMKSSFVRRILNEGLITESDLDYQAHVCKNTVAPNGCIVPSTRIKTENGIFSIKDLFAQQNIDIGEDFDPGTIFDMKTSINVETMDGLRKINKLYVNGQTETIKVSTKNGKEIEGTFNHKVLVKLDNKRAIWKPLEDLSKDDILLSKK